MTPDEIVAHVEKLRDQQSKLPKPSMSTYKEVLAFYERAFNDMLVLVRENAQHTHDVVVLDAQATRPRDPE